MKVLFLDIDGVLNSGAWTRRRQNFTVRVPDAYLGVVRFRDFREFDPAAVARLNSILEQTDAKIVISSTWRLNHAWYDLMAILAAVGLDTHRVIGRTPDGSTKEHGPLWAACERGTEIQMWLTENNHTGPFVVLDDTDDMTEVQDNLVLTDFARGLLDSHVVDAVRLLNGGE